jgi:hypothetical protein
MTASIVLNINSGPAGSIVGITGSGFSNSTQLIATFDSIAVWVGISTSAGLIPDNVSFQIPIATVDSHTITVTDGINSATASFSVTQLFPSSGLKSEGDPLFAEEYNAIIKALGVLVTPIIGSLSATVKGAKYIVYEFGGTWYVVDGLTNAILESNADAYTTFQWALDNLTVGRTCKEKIVVIGNLGTLTGTPQVSSNTCLDLEDAVWTAGDGIDGLLLGGKTSETTRITIYGGRIIGSTTSSHGVVLDFCNYCNIYDLWVQDVVLATGNVGKAVFLDGQTHGDCILNNFYGLQCRTSYIGLECYGAANANHFFGCSFDSNNIGVVIGTGSANIFYSPDIEYNNTGIADSGLFTQFRDVYFEGNNLEVISGNDALAQGTIILQGINSEGGLPRVTFGTYGCKGGLFGNENGQNIFDVINAPLGSGATDYTLTFPTRYQTNSDSSIGRFIISIELDWNSTWYVSNKVYNAGVKINFGTATPDATKHISIKFLMTEALGE